MIEHEFDNLIYEVGRDNNDVFKQYNDYKQRDSFFQCPKCLSLNVDSITTSVENTLMNNTKVCNDCGYSHKYENVFL